MHRSIYQWPGASAPEWRFVRTGARTTITRLSPLPRAPVIETVRPALREDPSPKPKWTRSILR